MKSRILVLMCPLILALVLSCPQVARADPAATKVGTCNVLTIINQMKEYQDLSKQLKSDRDKTQAEIDARVKKLTDLQDQLKLLLPASDAYAARDKEAANYKVELEVFVKEQQLQADVRQKKATKLLWDKVHAMIGQVARARGFTLIVADQSTEIPPSLDDPRLGIDTLNAIILQRTVLYADESVNITKEVIAELDKAYAAGH